jgi:hypothetical protein
MKAPKQSGIHYSVSGVEGEKDREDFVCIPL